MSDSFRNDVRTMMLNKMNDDGSDAKFSNMALVWFATDSAVRIQSATGAAADVMTSTLERLEAKGYGKGTPVADNQIKANDEINDVLIQLAKAAARNIG